MSTSSFEDLRVYRLSEDISDAVWDIVIEWDAFAKDTVGKQLVRAADSIGANIAEGTGRGPHTDNRRFIRTAQEEKPTRKSRRKQSTDKANR